MKNLCSDGESEKLYFFPHVSLFLVFLFVFCVLQLLFFQFVRNTIWQFLNWFCLPPNKYLFKSHGYKSLSGKMIRIK